MLAKSVDDFQCNWAQQLPLLTILKFSPRIYRGYRPQFLVFGEEVYLSVDIQCFSPKQLKKTDVHQFVQQKRLVMQRTHEALCLHLQAAQLRRNALYNSERHGPGDAPGDSVWFHSSVTQKS